MSGVECSSGEAEGGHMPDGNTRWRAGLFRYLPDSEALALYEALKAAVR